MIQNYNLHSCLLTLRQVHMSTIAAITHTALVGSREAAIRPAAKEIGAAHCLHRLIYITLNILLSGGGNVTVENSGGIWYNDIR